VTLALVALVALVATLWTFRRAKGSLPVPVAPDAAGAGWLAHAVVLASLAPLVWAVPRLVAPDALLAADAQAHAWVAQELARGVRHGWVDVCAGGFPFGPQYQSLLLVVAALLVKAGVPVVSAVAGLGLLSILAVPLLLTATLRAAGLGAAPAALGGGVAAWCVLPWGWAAVPDAYLVGGLVSQSFGLALVLLTAWSVLEGPAWAIAPLAALAVGAHTLLGALALVVVAPAVLVAAGPRIRRRFVWAGAGAVVAALALYGPGLSTMHLPVGWSRGSFDMLHTFPRNDLGDLATGELLDYGRAPGVTSVLLVALLGMVHALRDPRVRGALTVLFGVVALSLAGRVWGGAWVVEAIGPARAALFVPLAVGAAVAVGCRSWMGALGARTPVTRLLPWAVAVAVLAWGAGTRWPWLRTRVGLESELRGDRECGPATPAGYRTKDIAPWLASLPPGRFVVDIPSFDLAPGLSLAGPSLHGLELASSQPLGASAGGPGSQNGLMNDAFDEIRLTQQGADARAEALGVRTILHARGRRPAGDWEVLASRGDVVLSARRGDGAIVGVGCVGRVWRGSDRALRTRFTGPDGPRAWHEVLDPRKLVAFERGTGPVVEADVDLAGCDADEAAVTPLPREPGAYAADVQAPHDVDVVVRATTFPTWQVRVDGVVTKTRDVMPGFFAVRVPAGVHRVEAVVSALPFYGAGLAVGAAAIALLALLARRDRRSARDAAR